MDLRHQDLNLETGIIAVVQTVSRSQEKGIIIQPTKTGSSRRNVDLDDDTIEVLRAHIGRQMLTRMELEGSNEDHGFVFPGPLGKPLESVALNRVLRSFAKRVGLKEAKIHHLRHFHASVMLQRGASLLLVSRRLGHARVATTSDIYGHVLPGQQKEAANAFAKAMKKG